MNPYLKFQKLAKKPMKQWKQGVVELVQLTEGAGTDDNPGTPTETRYTLDATASKASYKYVNTGFALATDMVIISSVIDDVVPTMNDFIEVDGVRHKIVSDISVPAAGTKVLWKFIIRSGG